MSQTLGQELGHQWLSYAYFRDARGQLRDDTVGIEQAHWAFYFNSDRSPMDGMAWTDNGDGTFTAPNKLARPGFELEFSELELYLLGLMASDDAEASFLIEDPFDCVIDGASVACPDHYGSRALAMTGDSITVRGTRLDITVEDIIAAEGPRIPDAAAARRDHGVMFVVFKRPGGEIAAAEHEQIRELFTEMPPLWQRMTRNRGHLINVSATVCPAGS